MSKKEFLNELEKRLKYIPADDREDALLYYGEYLGDMNLADDDDVSSVIESPREIATKIIGECAEKHINEQEDKGTVKKTATAVWLTVLGILSLPISIPVAIIVFALVICLLVAAVSILIGVFATALGFGIAGFACIIAAFMAGTFGQTLVVLGTGVLFLAGCCLVFLVGVGIIKLIGLLCSLVFGIKRGKEDE